MRRRCQAGRKAIPMAEQHDEKSRLPLAGILALLAMVSSFLIYEGVSLKTARPVNKEAANNVVLGEGLVQARLWQDPFEAGETYRLQQGKAQKEIESKEAADTLAMLVNVIGQSGVTSGLRVLPVFVDGSPYVMASNPGLRIAMPLYRPWAQRVTCRSPANTSGCSGGISKKGWRQMRLPC